MCIQSSFTVTYRCFSVVATSTVEKSISIDRYRNLKFSAQDGRLFRRRGARRVAQDDADTADDEGERADCRRVEVR